MPEIELTDQSDFEFQLRPGTADALLGLLRSPARIRMLGQALGEIWNQPLSQSPLEELNFDLELEAPTGLAFGSVDLNIQAGVSGRFSVLTRPGKALFSDDRFLEDRQAAGGQDERIGVPEGMAYLVLGWGGSMGAEAEVEQGDVEFGISATARKILVVNYRLFPLDKPFGEAVQAAFEGFRLPSDLSGLKALDEGTAVSVQGEGALRFAFSADISSQASIFATSEIGGSSGGLGDLANVEVEAGASLELSHSVRIFRSHEFRIYKASPRQVRLGVYSLKGKESSFELSASAGLSLEVGGFDVAGQILGLFTGSSIDEKQLKQAGLQDEEIEQIDQVLKKAVSSKLELALELGLEKLSSSGPAFLYLIDLDAAGGDAQAVPTLQQALKGDLTAWTRRRAPLPAGIELVRSLDTAARSEMRSLSFNLFGLFNHISFEKLLLESFIEYDPQGDAVLVIDRATAKRYRIDLDRLADQQDRLRRLMLDSVMITAAYNTAGLAPRGLSVRYRHFILHQEASRAVMGDLLDTVRALGLISAQKRREALGLAEDFGRAALLAETAYARDETLPMFVEQQNGTWRARPSGQYETLGRRAFVELLREDEAAVSKARVQLLRSNPVWEEAVKLGDRQGILQLVREAAGADEVAGRVFYGDYLSVRWWAASMERFSKALADLLNFLKGRQVPLTDPGYLEHRKQLAQAASKVADNTEARFDDPWGLIAMDLAAESQGTAEVLLTNAKLEGGVYREERKTV